MNDRGDTNGDCEKLSLYFVYVVQDAQTRVVNPGASLETVKPNLKLVDYRVAFLVTKTLNKTSVDQKKRVGMHLGFYALLSFLTYILLTHSSNTWKEISAAFMPQLFTVIYHLVELAFKVEMVDLENNLKVLQVLSRGSYIVTRLLEDFTTV